MWSTLVSTDAGRPREPRPDGARPGWSAGTLGMVLLLVALGMLFAASIVAYLVLRAAALSRGLTLPHLPATLWLSTALIVMSSFTMQAALNAARRGAQRPLRVALLLTLLLGAGFLTSQTVAWQHIRGVPADLRGVNPAHPTQAYEVAPEAQARAFVIAFWFLTVLHAAHVLGGLAPLGVTAFHAFGGRYSAARHAGVGYITMYWHFLDVVWVVLFAVLCLTHPMA